MSLELKKVAKSFGATKALRGISFTLKEGEVVGLLGPNGAGKSTLMRILSGYYTNWDGDVNFFEKSYRNHLKSIKNEVGYLTENNPLYADMYVIEYLKYVAELFRRKKAPINQLIKKTGLLSHYDKKIRFLSKGYKQRVGIAAALINDPKLVILDEPTTGLDPNQLLEIRKLIRELGDKKIVLLSTHILQEVDAICDRVLIINQGEIVLDEKLKNLRKNKKKIILVSFDYRVETVALLKIEDVKHVRNIGGFSYEIETKGNKDKRSAIFDFANENGLKILSLNQKNESLEELFNSLTK
ncbi:gliding motility-associated ABC transporter ATP-binding subunit GldA [Bacteroidetes bacterium SCGC AAA795-G10]|nr:gliding motility-associated ABC transporter ATP-binding subunit GldA [Bacteroidetes bacterium SCGC AAA795-G10]